MTDGYHLMQRVNVVLLVLNGLGAFGYVARASLSWAIPEEQGLIPITGQPYIWVAAVVPILAVSLLLNLTWGALILGYRQRRSGRLWLLALLVWLIDRLRTSLSPTSRRQNLRQRIEHKRAQRLWNGFSQAFRMHRTSQSIIECSYHLET